MYKQKHISDSRSAFTLIEIMVAALITIIMIGLVIQITSEVLKVWNRSVGKLSANAEARIAMELLTSDLETALLVSNGLQWVRVEWDDDDSDVGSPPVGQTVGLKLFAPALDRSAGPGNVCAIAYRLEQAKAYEGANDESYVLFRHLAEPEVTFDTLLGPSSDDPDFQKELDGGFWNKSETTDPNNYLAGNIVDFKIYIIGVDEATGDEIVLNASGDNGFAKYDSDFDGTINLNYIYGGNDASDEDPLFAEISLTVVSDEGLEILSLFADPEIAGAGTGFENTDEVLLRHAEVFKRRVYFQAKSL